MPSFLHNLRRKSSRVSPKASDKHNDTATDGTTKTTYGAGRRPSSSTLNLSPVGSSTPSTTPATSTTDGDAPPVPNNTRPQRPSVDPVKRYSMNVSKIALLLLSETEPRRVYPQHLPTALGRTTRLIDRRYSHRASYPCRITLG